MLSARRRRAYYHPQNANQTSYFLIMIIFLGIGIFLGSFLFGSTEVKEVIKEVPTSIDDFPKVTLSLPAVDGEGNGVLTEVNIQAIRGEGRILTDINVILFLLDTQQSIQTARNVSQDVTGLDLDEYDLIYDIEAGEATVVGGPSAGAALTVATIAALRGEQPRNDVIITGTINPDGTIGKVGGVSEKARAAKEGGATLFLVPEGESIEVKIEPTRVCDQKRNFEFCRTIYERQEINIGHDIGIDVREVRNIEEAMGYFLD